MIESATGTNAQCSRHRNVIRCVRERGARSARL